MAQAHISIQKPTHKAMTTAHLVQTMNLLELNNENLAKEIAKELSDNPALELKEELSCPTCGRKLSSRVCPFCSKPASLDVNDPIVFVSTRTSYNSGTGSGLRQAQNEAENTFEDFSPEKEDIATYVLNQIRTELGPDEPPIAVDILFSLDENGFLIKPLIDIAVYHHVMISKVEHVKSLIQSCEPYGIASESVQEALIVQAKILSEIATIPPRTIQILTEGYDEITQKKNRELSKKLGLSIAEINETENFIRENLNPYPARAHWGDHRNVTDEHVDRYQNPDFIISLQGPKDDPQLFVEVLWPIPGTLTINPAYKNISSEISKEQQKVVNHGQQKANLMIKCITQRNNTLIQLMKILAKKQRQYILKGDLYMAPITRASLAEELSLHESTISRAVSGKCVQLPSGKIIPVSQFFDRSLYIRTRIKNLIAAEGEKPISDTKITKLLIEDGIDIARRTVAKYRSMEGILPTHLRKKSKQSDK